MSKRLSDDAKGMLAASAAYIIFGFSYLFSKMALNVTEPLILLCLRFTLTFVTLNVLVLTRICRISLKGKKLIWPVLVGLVQPCLYFGFYDRFSVRAAGQHFFSSAAEISGSG